MYQKNFKLDYMKPDMPTFMGTEEIEILYDNNIYNLINKMITTESGKY